MTAVAETKSLNCVLLVMNDAISRIDSNTEHTISKLQSLLPKNLTKNLFVILTNVSFKPKLKVEDVLNFEIEKERVFFFDN